MKNNCAVNETAKVLQLRKCSFERFALKGEVKASKRRRGDQRKPRFGMVDGSHSFSQEIF